MSDSLPFQVSVPLPDAGYTDARGHIQNLLLRSINSVARITSKKGTVRANHYHKTDWHYAFVESGLIEYHESTAPVSDDLALLTQAVQTLPRTVARFGPGQMFFSGSNIIHAMVFVEDTVFYTFAQNIRSHENHESDVVRFELVSQEEAAKRYG